MLFEDLNSSEELRQQGTAMLLEENKGLHRRYELIGAKFSLIGRRRYWTGHLLRGRDLPRLLL
jgi:hypothetical protein